MERLGNLFAMRFFLIANETLARLCKFLPIGPGEGVRMPKFFCNELRDAWNEITA
jgi:hypothetical protein